MPVTENISVHVRVRPLSESEKERGSSAWRVEGNSLAQVDTSSDARVSDAHYTLDTVFDPDHSTEEVYLTTTQAIIHQVVQGFNGTVFAYGQTSSGKTHTMRGSPGQPGIVTLAVHEVFNLITAAQHREFLLRVSYMEIYNEDINDLLAPENQRLQVHESKEAGVHVAGLREEIVTSPEQVLSLLDEGECHRHVGETKMNKNSSRSHTIFRMVVESRSMSDDGNGADAAAEDDFGAIRVSSLTLVDLAGSERIAKTGAEGQRAREGAAINKSLLTLGTVINRLSEGGAAGGGHVPYRDSKLTRILQPALGGNARTAIICAVTPAAPHVEETHSTLRFACRAKRVVNNATVNEVLSDAAVLKRQAREIEELRGILQREGAGADVEAQINSLRAELLRKEQDNDRMQMDLAAEKEERERAQRKIDSMTRLMLDQRKKGTSSSPDEGRRSTNRRETWCPGAAQRKRPLLVLPASIQEGGDEEEEEEDHGLDAMATSRRSEGGAAVQRADADLAETKLSSALPPHKRRAKSLPGDEAPDINNIEDDDTGALQERVAELTTAQAFMQRELDRLAALADEQARALQEREMRLGELEEACRKQEPRVQETEWRARQLSGQLEEARAALAAAEQELEAQCSVAEQREAGWKLERALLESRNTELEQGSAPLREEILQLKTELLAGTERLDEAVREKGLLEAKHARQKQELDAQSDALQMKEEELVSTRATADAATEKLAEAETRARNFFEENARLEAHISDLESRKRAPLYQKRQEEELRAALESAKEAEIRAAAAELEVKEAKAAEEAAIKAHTELKVQVARMEADAADAALESAARLEAVQSKAASELSRVEAAHALSKDELQSQLESIHTALREAQSIMKHHEEELSCSKLLIEKLAQEVERLKSSLEEAQQCADTATLHIQFLEEKAESEAAAAAEAAAELQRQLEQARQDLVDATQAAQAAAEEALAREQALTCEHEAQMSATKLSHEEELGAALAEHQELVAKRRELQETIKGLEEKLVAAAAGLAAADELRDLRRRHKEDVARLTLALKTATQGSKGSEKATDKAQKEADKLRSKVTDLEGKLRAAVQDKNTAQNEKAAAERELKVLRGQTERLTKNMDKISGVEEKKRESIMVGFNQTKSRLQIAEEALHRASVEVEKLQSELGTKTSQLMGLEEELKTVKDDAAEVSQERDELSQELAGVRAEVDNLRDSWDASKAECAELKSSCDDLQARVAELGTEKASLEEQLAAANEHHAAAVAEVERLEGTVASMQTALDAGTAELEQKQKALEEAVSRVENLEASIGRLQEAAETSREQLSSTESSLEEQKNETDSLRVRVQELEGQIVSLQGGNAKLKDELQRQTDELAQATQRLHAALARTDEVEASKAATESRLQEETEHRTTLSHDLDLAKKQVLEWEEQARRLHEETSGKQQELETKLEEMNEKEEAARNQVSELSMRLATVQGEVAVLDGAKWTMQTERDSARQEVENLRESLKRVEKEKMGIFDDMAEVEERLKMEETERASVEKELQHCQAELDQCQEICNDLDMRVVQAEERAKLLTRQSDALRQSTEALHQERGVLTGQIEALETALQEAQATRLEAQREADQGVETAVEDVQRLTKDLDSARHQLEETQQQAEALKQELAAAEEQLLASAEEIHRQAETSAQQIQALEEELARAQTDAAAAPQQQAGQPAPELVARCSALEEELRKSKRREEKLQALLYRLREDIKACGGDLAALDDVRDRRSLEYELDRMRNRSSREKAVLREKLTAAMERCATLEKASSNQKSTVQPRRGILQPIENE